MYGRYISGQEMMGDNLTKGKNISTIASWSEYYRFRQYFAWAGELSIAYTNNSIEIDDYLE